MHLAKTLECLLHASCAVSNPSRRIVAYVFFLGVILVPHLLTPEFILSIIVKLSFVYILKGWMHLYE